MGEFRANNQHNHLVQWPDVANADFRAAIESGTWPADFFLTLLDPVERWAATHPTTYHHVGYTFPNKETFDAATASAPAELLANNLEVRGVTHQRRYLRRPDEAGGSDTFVEYHMVGDEGNGVTGVHFDIVTDDADGFLAYLKAEAEMYKGDDATVVTGPFGGGNAPVGKVELQLTENPKLSVGVMARTHWSDPVNW